MLKITGREATTVLSVRLVIQSTFPISVSAASGISAEEEIPESMISKPYFGASSLYSAMADSEFTSLVEMCIRDRYILCKQRSLFENCVSKMDFQTGSLSFNEKYSGGYKYGRIYE